MSTRRSAPIIATLLIAAVAVAAVAIVIRRGSSGPDAAAIAENNRGVGLMGQYSYEPARVLFQQLLDRYPEWNDVKVNVAIATLNRQQDGDEQMALALLEQVLLAEPDHLSARYCRGLLYNYLGSPELAIDDFRFVAEADPTDAYAAYYLAQSMSHDQPEEAEAWFLEAIDRDPYLRSAYYGLSRLYLKKGDAAAGQQMQAIFDRLADNPQAKLVAFTYAQMGPKGRAATVDLTDAAPAPPPAGPVFEAATSVCEDSLEWSATPTAGITACNIDGEHGLDLFVTGAVRGPAVNAVLLDDGAGAFAPAADHPLASVPAVLAALWGDVDNDGLTDVYLCRDGSNQLWRQTEPGVWSDVTESTETGGGALRTVAGVMVDADHDGDLDVFCVNADGPNELFSNNLDGTFRPLGASSGLAGTGRASRQAVFADLDRDRDLDLIVINDDPPHEAYVNELLWEYRPADGFDELLESQVGALVAGDVDADGQVELFATTDVGVVAWRPDDGSIWRSTPPVSAAAGVRSDGHAGRGLALLDVDGDGVLDLLASTGGGWAAWHVDRAGAGALIETPSTAETAQLAWQPVVLDARRGPAVASVATEGAPIIWHPGAGRHVFLGLELTGKEDSDTMRSNASGIGAEVAVRADSRWTVLSTLPAVAQPGQSLQPIAIGLGGEPVADFIAIEWSDGVFQSELTLGGGELHRIPETQRQISSCPVLFAWNGSGYQFVTDLLGVGGLGFAVGRGEYAPSRPWERLLLPDGVARPRDGRYEMRLGEPMEEACYLDAARLVAYDLPPGWSMTLDERMSILGPEPTGEPVFFRRTIPIRRGINDRGEDVTSALRDADGVAAPVGRFDRRFIGRLESEHVLTLELDEPLDRLEGAPVLVIDGWVEYPYSQTMFAAWQAEASYDAPTLEARDAEGSWVVLLEQFGYPAGMPRQSSIRLPSLPSGTTALRLRTNQEIYWDRLVVVCDEPCPEATRRPLTLIEADVRRCGFPTRSTGDQRRPDYDYGTRLPEWDTRHQRGLYTALGPAAPLVSRTDDAVAIFGPGEEIALAFEAAGSPPPSGWTRRLVIEVDGWCKDMDLYTRDGATLEPLPSRGVGPSPRDVLHRRFNTRFESGR